MTAPERVAELRAAQAEVDSEVLTAAASFPTYEVPAFVTERFPRFDPADPSTWPEPDRCTDGLPWGHTAYSYGPTGPPAIEDRWRQYLAALASERRPPGICRNRWKDPEARLCGTHVKPWREAIERSRRRSETRARELRHLDLARQLAAYGIEGDGIAHGVLLRADAVEGLLRILAEADRVAPL